MSSIASAVKPWPLLTYKVAQGGKAVTVVGQSALGGYIINPASMEGQALPVSESLFVDIVGPAALQATATTVELVPGQRFDIPKNFVGNITVNAQSSGHRFSGIVLQPPPNFQNIGDFPPPGPTTVTKTLPSYLYQQYNDDEDLQAFVDAYNQMAQQYVTFFATIGLPIYSGDQIQGSLLDWVAAGIYGMTRPVLPFGVGQTLGPFNTAMFNTIAFNTFELHGPPNYYLTSDDIFKRILTWHLYRGDGFTFNIRWLKRRVERFLTGTNGDGGSTDQTYDVSVTFGTDNEVNINLQTTRRLAKGGSIYNSGAFNSFAFNQFDTEAINLPSSPLIPIFKAAVQAGVLELPFQYTFIVNTN